MRASPAARTPSSATPTRRAVRRSGALSRKLASRSRPRQRKNTWRSFPPAAGQIGAVLAGRGVMSRFGIDFLARRREGTADWELFALEINLRIGGTTHPFLALQFLTGGRLDPQTGLFHSLGRLPKFYRSTDNLKSDAYRGLCPEDLIDITTANRLHYDHGSG